ncbi:MAG: hypothetical protein KDD20_06815 [Mangrovimonas sp.]|nr:hypothetical protein [Mangrovimonas sp.]
MKSNYLLPHKYKTMGWVLFVIGLLSGSVLFFNGYDSSFLNVKVLTIYYEPIFSESSGFFKIVDNTITDELVSLLIIIGGLLVGFSKEKVEDEFIYKLRKDSLVWAILFNYFILIATILLVYDLTFFHILVFNMFTPLVFFIIRFNFLKYKANSHDE